MFLTDSLFLSQVCVCVCGQTDNMQENMYVSPTLIMPPVKMCEPSAAAKCYWINTSEYIIHGEGEKGKEI